MKRVHTISQLFSPSPRKKNGRLLAIFAHPDDESILIGGLLSRAHAEGIQTHVLCMTNGELGGTKSGVSAARLASIRKKELHHAAEILGICRIITPGLPDGSLFYKTPAAKRIISSAITAVRPSLVITHDPSGITNHPDHITVSALTKRVVAAKKLHAPLLYVVVLGTKEKKFRLSLEVTAKNWHSMPPATHNIPLRQYHAQKMHACLAHKSQQLQSVYGINRLVWYRFFDSEYLHLVNLSVSCRYIFSSYRAADLKFDARNKKTVWSV